MTHAIRARYVVDANGQLHLPPLPHAIGKTVDVIILVDDTVAVRSPRYPLRGRPYQFDEPFAPPISAEDWEQNL